MSGDFPRGDSEASDVGFPTVQSIDALLEQYDEKDKIIQEELRALQQAADEKAKDSKYWGRLYHAISEDYQEDSDDDIGIDRVLAKKRDHNVVFYQVRWKQHQTVTWERADDIMAARTLLTAFDTHLRNNPKAKERLYTTSSNAHMSRRERRARRQEKEEAEAEGYVAPPVTSTPTPVKTASTPIPASLPRQTAPTPSAPAGPAVKSYKPEEILRMIEKLDNESKSFQNKVADLSVKVPEWGQASIDALLNVYNEIIAEFSKDEYKRTYNIAPGDESLTSLQPGKSVPAYFANVSGESIWRRKMLSLAGLRNLVVYGRQIYTEMRSKRFIGDPSAYSGDVGPNKMKTFTGNVVDLDTTVLRCSDRLTLNAINDWNKHHKQKTWGSTAEFGGSHQAQEIAATAAITMLEDFNKDFKLSKSQMKERKTDLSDVKPGSIPLATHNTDRGKWPCWHYVNAGVDSFHANVPSIDDVNGALLRAPLHCVIGWLHAKKSNRLQEFFEDCVVDSCFNMKWKAIEEYNLKYEKEGSINQIIEQLQMDHQGVFNKIFDEDDDGGEKEAAAILKLLGSSTFGRDSTGSYRAITSSDVKKWVADPSVRI